VAFLPRKSKKKKRKEKKRINERDVVVALHGLGAAPLPF
jgi:hypothetical protein